MVIDISCFLFQNNATVVSEFNAIADSNHDIILIDFVLPGGVNLNLKLASTMVRAIILLLDQLRQQAGWSEAVLAIQNGDNAASNLQEKICTVVHFIKFHSFP